MRKESILIFVVLACALATVAGAAVVDLSVVWNKTYGKPGANDSAYSIVQVPGDRGYVFAGETGSFGAGETDAWVVGLSGSGAERWNRTYGDPGKDTARSVINTSDGNYLFAGTLTFVTGENRRDTDVLVVKFSPTGDIIWNETFGGPDDNATAYAVAETADGGYIVVGATAFWGEPDTDALVIKLNGSGSEEWSRTFGEPELNDSAYAVVAAPSGDIGVAGSTESFEAFETDAFVQKIDPSGSEAWNVTFGGAENDTARSIVLAPDGGFVFSGSYMSRAASGRTDDDALVVKMRPDGKVAWNWTYGDAGENESTGSIIATRDGGCLFVGRTGKSPLDNDAWVVKLDGTGAVEGDLTIGGANPGDRAASVIQTAASEYVFAGTFNSTKKGGTPETDAWVVKLTTKPKTVTKPPSKPPKPPKVCPAQCPPPTPKPTITPRPKTGSIGDFVWSDTNKNGIQDGGEPGIQGVTVKLLNAQQQEIATRVTDSRGNYVFSGLQPGDYYVRFSPPKGYTFTKTDAGGDDAKDSDADQTTGRTAKIALRAGERQFKWDAGMIKQAPSTGGQIGDLVWEDTNKDGIQDTGEKGVAGVTVRLLDGTGNPVPGAGGNPREVKTDANGKYLFADLAAGNYIVEFVAPESAAFTVKGAGSDAAKDSDADQTTGRTGVIALKENELQDRWDAGLVTGPAPGTTAEVHGRVWEDVNGDNIQQREQANQEPGIPNIEVKLRKADGVGTIQDRTTTNADGIYQFKNVPPGNYYLEFSLIAGYKFVAKPDQGNDNEDSDVDPLSGMTESFTLRAGEIKDHWDAGMTRFTGEIGGTVWEDNGNGILEDSAAGDHGAVAGVVVSLMKHDGGGQYTRVATDATDANGVFLFSGLAPGQYGLVVKPPAWAAFTKFDQYGAGRNNVGLVLDSNGYGFIAPPITLGVGDSQKQWDVGLLRKSGSFRGSTDWGQVGRDLAHWFLCPPPLNWMGICLVAPILSPLDLTGSAGAIAGTGMGGASLFDGTVDVYVDGILHSWLPGILQMVTGLVQSAGTGDTVQANSGASLTPGSPGSLPSENTPSSGDSGFPDIVYENETHPPPDVNTTGIGVILGGVVNDTNRNNELDADEAGVPGIEVQLLASNGLTDSGTTTSVTDGNGTYIFTNLTLGEYSLQFTLPPGYEFTCPVEGSDLDPQTGRSTVIEIRTGKALAVMNVGIAKSPSRPLTNSTIGDLVWNDTDGNGIQDKGEEGIAGAIVELYYANETLANSTTTDADGAYLFTALPAGEYHLVFGLPEGYNFTPANQGADDARDSDADPATGRTASITLAGNETQLDWDAGLNLTPAEVPAENGSIGDFVWEDTNQDGIQDPGEPGLSDVGVILIGADGSEVTTVTTGAGGAYLFTGILPGTYSVRFEAPADYTFTAPDQGSDDADSDADPSSGTTAQFELGAGEEQIDWDAGMYLNVSETPEPTVTPEEEETTPGEEVTPGEERTPEGSIL